MMSVFLSVCVVEEFWQKLHNDIMLKARTDSLADVFKQLFKPLFLT